MSFDLPKFKHKNRQGLQSEALEMENNLKGATWLWEGSVQTLRVKVSNKKKRGN